MIGENEKTIESIGIKDYIIIQSKHGFRFGIDAVLLANFVRPRNGEQGVDLGSGTGIIPTIVAAKSKAKKIIGIEIQEKEYRLALESAKTNSLEDRISFVNMDIRSIPDCFEKHFYDFVISNPPYYKTNTLSSPNTSKSIARHEVKVTLSDILESAAFLLKPQKNFYMIHRPERLVEIFETARNCKLEPKEIRFVHPNAESAPNLVLLRFSKFAKSGLKYLPPLFVYKKSGEYTDDILELYSKNCLGE